ncbi:hypothetical protein M758_2G003700 [Ceratodon purpureus]|nr:hypothetical protein M758_2G003700 [Ceratodon purpureus]
MQLLAQTDAAAAAQPEASQDSLQSVSEGDAPASPSSPSSPSKSNAAREKPVKVLPCPRCESMNTKFCYYNNYSVTQPRHFCRQCQRYWTAGGTLRNVPVGGGSRKKNRHPRGGEPYLQRSSGNPSGPFGVPASGGQSVLQNVGFQQMLTQDMVALSFAQLPGFAPHGHQYASYGLQDPNQGVYASMMNRPAQETELPPSMHAMYGTGPMSAPMAINSGGYYVQEMAPPLPTDNADVKPEFWTNNSMPAPQSLPPHGPNPNQVNNPGKNGRFESSMLLNLGLNNRPPSQGSAKPVWDQSQHDVKPPVAAGNTKNGSPPHGSSTIEEEGSTPTNGYSNSGYEEGDTVSSMWHSLHEDNMFQDTMFQLNGEDRC